MSLWTAVTCARIGASGARSRAPIALGDEHRQRIVFAFEREERLSAGQMVAVSTLSHSTVSHHLKLLKAAGVLESQRVGRFYWVSKKSLERSRRAVLDCIGERAQGVVTGRARATP